MYVCVYVCMFMYVCMYSHTNLYISKSMLHNNADVRQCSYFELGLPVGKQFIFRETWDSKETKLTVSFGTSL